MSKLDKRAAEIAKAEGVGFVVARIRAAREMFGVPAIARPMNKAEVRDLVMDGSIVPFAVLAEIAGDSRSSPDTRIAASDKFLGHAIKLQGEEGPTGSLNIVVKGGLPE